MMQWLKNLFSESLMQGVTKEQRHERRLHARHSLRPDNPLLAVLEHKATSKVLDLSYGGISLEITAGALAAPAQNAKLSIMIKLLHRSHELIGFPIYHGSTSWGLAFIHEKPESLLFLRDILEPMRCGGTLLEMSRGEEKNPQGEVQQVIKFQGDGPTSLSLYTDVAGKPQGIYMTMRAGDTYYGLNCQQGALSTSENIDGRGVAARMGRHENLNKDVLFLATCTLMGFSHPQTAGLLPWFVSYLPR